MFELYALVFAAAVAITALLIWILSKAAPYIGLVDHPHGRKSHVSSTPVVGGLAILIGAVLALVIVMQFRGQMGVVLNVLNSHIGFVIGAVVLLGMGVVDDRRPIPARYKLLIQVLCCVTAVFMDDAMIGDIGVYFGTYRVSLGPLGAPLSVLVLLTITNAINMIDGVDGLAGGITLVGVAITCKALVTAGFISTPYVIALMGALVAFLAFNFPLLPGQRAKVFLGDSGSLLFGFTLGYIAIELSALPNRVYKPSTALWFFFIPVADTIWIYLRRLWIARAPFAAGRDHIHHLLMEHFSPRLVTWLLVSTSAVFAALAYLAERKGVPSYVLILAWVVLFLVYGAVSHKAWKRAWLKSRSDDEVLQAYP